MAEIVNLRQARKRKKRAAKEETARENRIRFGRTKAEKNLHRLQTRRADADLDGKRRDIREDGDIIE